MSQNNGIFVQSFYSIITKVFRPRDGRRRVTQADVMLHLSIVLPVSKSSDLQTLGTLNQSPRINTKRNGGTHSSSKFRK